MRKRFLSLFCVLAFCLTLLSVTAWAAGPDWTYDPVAATLTWTDPDTSSTIILNNVTNDAGNLTIGSNTSFSGDLNLSGTISDSGNTAYQITAIGDSAFLNCGSLKTVDLPASLASIGGRAFCNCALLEKVDLSGCTSLASIGDRAFLNCALLEKVDLSGCTGMENIWNDAFGGCGSLKTVNLSGCTSLASIGSDAFRSCDSLETLDLRGCTSLASIGNNAFCNCDSIETLDLRGCTSLESIGVSAFWNCDSLETVDLPASLESIGEEAFYDCDSLTQIQVAAENQNFSAEDGVLFDKNQTVLILYPQGKTESSYQVPETVKEIRKKAFYNCDSLKTLDLPASLKSIGDMAFYNCGNLAELVVLAETPPTLGIDSLTTGSNSLCILVPAECVETYQQHTDWSSFASMTAGLSCNLTVTPDNDSQVLPQGKEPQPVIFTVIRQDTDPDAILFSFPVSSLQISLTDGASFVLDRSAMNTVLAPNEKTTFSVALKGGLEPGQYQTTIQLNSAFLAQPITASLTCTVKAVENSEIQVNPDSLDFGSLTEGYTQAPAAQTVTLTNTGNQTVTVTLPTSTNYTMTAGTGFAHDTATLAPNGTAAFTVQPQIGLAIGTYSETLTISGTNQTEASLTANFTVVPRNSGSGGGHATTSNPQYAVTVLETENGSIRVSPERAKEGDRVKVTAVPQTGYALDSLTVTDTDGKTLTLNYMETNVYTFEMPKGEAEISAVFAPATAQPTQPTISFIDVQPNHWFYDAVCYVVEHGLMHGMSDDTFSPNTPLQREMFAVILWNLEGNPAPEDVAFFLDVTSDKYYAEAIAWANENGIAAGYGDTFGVGESITREQFAVMLHNYAQYQSYDVSVGEDTNILSYADAFDISNYAYPAMQWVCGAGIMGGNDDGTLNPKGSTTRAEAATMLMNFCKNVK